MTTSFYEGDSVSYTGTEMPPAQGKLYGDPALPERFWEKAYPEPNTSCWIWGASLFKNGYGQYRHEGTMHYAHRVAYSLLIGPIPEGLELDHLCRTKWCCNPAHLEAVTHAENMRRAGGQYSAHARKTHCPAGHGYIGANLKTNSKGHRFCRTCHGADSAARRRRKALVAL